MGLFPALPIRGHQDTTLNFEKLQRQLEPDWKLASALGFEHAWVAFEATKRLPEYRRVFDVVELRGLIKGGESAKSAFFLPEKFRPKEEKAFIVDAQENTGQVFVFATGEVRPVNLGGEVKVFTYLDAVRFSVS